VVSGSTIYEPGTTSVPDPAGEALNRERLAPIDNFLTYLGHAVDAEPQTGDLSCPYKLLEDWAKAGALLQTPGTPGRVARVWISPAFGFVALKFRMRGIAILPDIAHWLSALAAVEREDYDKPLKMAPYQNLHSNVYPWVGVANAIAALIVPDPEAMKFQETVWRNMLAEIKPDGSLQGELGRGQRALIYHQQAANGLVVLGNLRHSLGQGEGPQTHQLQRLLNFVGEAICDSAPLAKMAGAQQEMPGVWGFRMPYAFGEQELPATWTRCGPKSMDWFMAEYGGGDTRVSAAAVREAQRHYRP
jgi:poly(beta-D-mannuronate) lyase